ncbi:MAG: hypothetical protein JW956_15285 [Calditrichaceae bacterium]|nr:hypothetical protein [Calditrichaceae bacterium]
MSSCYSDYLSVHYEVHWNAQWNTDHSKITYIASKTAYLEAKGIAKFPDGGIPKYLMQDVSLYVFDPCNHKLDIIVDFNDLTRWIGPSRSKWKAELLFTDSLIYYEVLPASGWELFLNNAKTEADSTSIAAVRDKYSKSYVINIETDQIRQVDSTDVPAISKDANKIELTTLTRLLSVIQLEQWGLVVQDIYPKPDEEYIEETIYLYNNSVTTRFAVIEQIISKLNKEEIEDLLNKMDEHQNSLEGLEKSEYEIYSKETYEKIKSLL